MPPTAAFPLLVRALWPFSDRAQAATATHDPTPRYGRNRTSSPSRSPHPVAPAAEGGRVGRQYTPRRTSKGGDRSARSVAALPSDQAVHGHRTEQKRQVGERGQVEADGGGLRGA